MFKRGYDAVEKEKARQEQARENMGLKLWDFFLRDDGDEADLRFLTEEPVNFNEHNIQANRNGKTFYDKFVCTGEGCPLCAEGNKATFKGAYLVVDKREFEYKKDGKTVQGKDQVRMYIQGTRVLSQLDRISTRYGLSNRDVTIVRLGKGTQTTYTVERGEESKLAEEEIRTLLPDTMKEDYDGTMESLYKMVEEQLLMRLPEGVEEDIGNTKEVDEEIVSVESKPKVKPLRLGQKPVENSIKNMLRKKK